MLPYHGVLLRRAILANQPSRAQRPRLGGHQVHRRLLHLPAQHPAAHQPRIQHKIVRRIHPADHDGDDAVIAKRVGQPQLQAEAPQVRHHRQHIVLGIAAGGQVELVGLVDQLHDAGQAGAVERPVQQLHPQAAQIGVHVGGGGAQHLAADIALVLAGTLPIFPGNRHALKISGIGQAGHHPGRVLRDFRHRHHRQLTADQGALGRVVVHEHHRIQADAEAVGDGAQIAGLVLPVGLETGDIHALQQHVRMPLERLHRVGLVVLGAHGQNHAAPCLLARIVLQR